MSRFVNIMEGRGSVMMTSIQEAQEKSNLGPPWMCTQCGKQNKSQCQRCEACKHMRPDLRVQHVVQRAQQARQGGLLIGRGGGFFQRQASEHKDDLSDDEFDVYGRRRSRRKSGTEATSKAKDSSSAAADDAAARRKAALERLRTPRKARSRTRSPARGGDEADRLEERDSHLPVQAPQHSQPQVPSRPPSQFQPGLQEQERQLMLLQAEQELQEREQQQLQQQQQQQFPQQQFAQQQFTPQPVPVQAGMQGGSVTNFAGGGMQPLLVPITGYQHMALAQQNGFQMAGVPPRPPPPFAMR
uniref:RanBP2-type domain-containing protein n=1 Tax=Alexandrium monilatum TaxID=311494 RepID=A0A7S4R0Q5_9DINO